MSDESSIGRRQSTPPPEPPVAETQDAVEVAQEQDAWKDVLGANVEVPPLPANITPEIKRNMERLGFELRYIPKLNLGTLDDLKREGEKQFLNGLQRRYPNWRRCETLSDTERVDHSVTRNLEGLFWELAIDGNMEFPQSQGAWVAVESVKKPSRGESYDKTPAMEAMGLDNYSKVSAENADQAIQERFLPWFSEQTGLRVDDIDARMLTAVELNLLVNREGWGKTNSEWTSTKVHADGRHYRIIVGYSDAGSAARARWSHPSNSNDDVGFRVAVVFRT